MSSTRALRVQNEWSALKALKYVLVPDCIWQATGFDSLSKRYSQQTQMSTVLAQDFQTALNAFGETMAASISHHSTARSSYLASGFRQAQWLFATFGCYAQQALSKTDVAVMFLSRKILVDQVGLAAIGSSLPGFHRHPSAIAGPQHLPVGYMQSHVQYPYEPRSARAVLGAMLFLAAVESGWQLHHRTVQYLPKNLQAAMSPLQVGHLILQSTCQQLYCLYCKHMFCFKAELYCIGLPKLWHHCTSPRATVASTRLLYRTLRIRHRFGSEHGCAFTSVNSLSFGLFTSIELTMF